MAYCFEFDSANKILQCRFTGRVSDEELKHFYEATAQYAGALGPHGAIVDFTGVESFDVTPLTVRVLAKAAPAVPDPHRPRIIVASSPHIFGMARMFEFEGESTRPSLHVVRRVEDAWTILGVERPHFDIDCDHFDEFLNALLAPGSRTTAD
jgi:hypothetical protein